MARAPVHPLWGLLEIVALAALFFAGIWLVAPQVERGAAGVVAYWVLVIVGGASILWLSPIVLHRDPPELRGWGPPSRGRTDPGALGNAWRSYAAFTAAAAAILIGAAAWRDPALATHIRWGRLGVKFLLYVVMGPAQALIYFGFLQTRIRTMLPPAAPGFDLRRRLLVGVLTASGFALIHLPNAQVMALVFPAGLCWSWLFYARPNVPLMGASHAVLGTIVQNVLMMHTRIGPFYAEPQHYAFVNAIPGLRALLGPLY